MKVMMLLIFVDALGMVPRGFKRRLEELEIAGGIETIQTRALLRSARILRRVLDVSRLTVTKTPEGISA